MIPFRHFPYHCREPKPSVSLDGLSLSGHQHGFDAGLSNSTTKGWADQCRQKELEICLHIVYYAQTPHSFADCHKDSNKGRLQAAADRWTCNKEKTARNRDSSLRLNPIVTPCKLISKPTEDPAIANADTTWIQTNWSARPPYQSSLLIGWNSVFLLE